MEGDVGPELVEGTAEPGRAEEGKDLERLALEGGPAGRIMEERNAHAGAELEERGLELELLGDAGVDELLERGLAEALELRVLEATRKTLDAGDAEALVLPGRSVEHVDAGGGELAANLGSVPGLEVMVAEHGALRDLELAEFLDEPVRLLGRAVVGQIAGEQEDVGFVVDALEHVPNGLSGVGAAMEIPHGCDSHPSPLSATAGASP